MKYLILLAAISITTLACNKDKFNTKPTLTFKSVNTKTVITNSELIFDLNVTDAEGDLSDTIFIMRKVRNCPQSNRFEKYKLPIFPTKTNLNVNLLVGYAYNSPASSYLPLGAPACANKNDSCIYRFVIKDKAGNLSDTVNSPEFVILR